MYISKQGDKKCRPLYANSTIWSKVCIFLQYMYIFVLSVSQITTKQFVAISFYEYETSIRCRVFHVIMSFRNHGVNSGRKWEAVSLCFGQLLIKNRRVRGGGECAGGGVTNRKCRNCLKLKRILKLWNYVRQQKTVLLAVENKTGRHWRFHQLRHVLHHKYGRTCTSTISFTL